MLNIIPTFFKKASQKRGQTLKSLRANLKKLRAGSTEFMGMRRPLAVAKPADQFIGQGINEPQILVLWLTGFLALPPLAE